MAEDRAEAIVLGCAGMTDLTEFLSARHGLPVLDGVVCALTLCSMFVVRLKVNIATWRICRRAETETLIRKLNIRC